MNWTTKGVAALATGITLFCGMGTVTAMALTGHHTTTPAAAAAGARPPKASAARPPAPKAKAAGIPPSHNGPTYNGPVTIINQAPQPGSTVYVPVPAYAPAYVTTNQAVVQQYYDYLNAKDFSAAWDMGGRYIGGCDYSSWVAGYSTTSWVTLSTWDYYPGYNAVGVTISATQTDGSVRTYAGSYTVNNGAITSASITQISGGSGSARPRPPGSGTSATACTPTRPPPTRSRWPSSRPTWTAGTGTSPGPPSSTSTAQVTNQSYLMTSSSVGEPVVVTGGNGVLVQFNH